MKRTKKKNRVSIMWILLWEKMMLNHPHGFWGWSGHPYFFVFIFLHEKLHVTPWSIHTFAFWHPMVKNWQCTPPMSRCQFILWWCHNNTWKPKFSLMPFCKSADRYTSWRANEASKHPFMSRRFCQLSMHPSGLQGNTVRTIWNVWEEYVTPLAVILETVSPSLLFISIFSY
jgi:hypothetical protein